MKAITWNAKFLLLTLFMDLIIVYIFTVFMFWFNPDMYYDDSIAEYSCVTMVQCYTVTLQQGLRNGGGIGDFLPAATYDPVYRERYYVKFVVDVIFFIMINIILLNIIFGIIVDTFGRMIISFY